MGLPVSLLCGMVLWLHGSARHRGDLRHVGDAHRRRVVKACAVGRSSRPGNDTHYDRQHAGHDGDDS
jgi:hypothetical protein